MRGTKRNQPWVPTMMLNNFLTDENNDNLRGPHIKYYKHYRCILFLTLYELYLNDVFQNQS